jgi:hypothetical protein
MAFPDSNFTLESSMKIKFLAAACAALCSAAAFAAPLATNTGVPAGLVTYYISGASAQAQAVSAILPTTEFFAVPNDVVKLTGGSVNDARYGMSNPAVTGGTSKPLLIVYRNSNGSGSGVRQLMGNTLTDIAAIPNTDNTGLVTLATCGATSGAAGSWTAACTSTEARVPDVALADVNPIELPGTFPVGSGYATLASLVTTKNALQGFGIAANPALYAALQAQNIREGSLAASCAGSATADCQPSIRKAVYASLISAEGSIKDANGLLNTTGDTTEITVCRRTDLSGTQATSNSFFLNNVCGTAGYKGFYNPLGAADSAPGQIVFNEGSSTSNAKACINTAAGYKLGILSLENIPAGADTYKFVKIDGVSPNYTYNGTAVVADPKQRQQFASGSYPYALEMYSAYKATAPANVIAFANSLNAKLGDSTLSDLVGIAYEDGANLPTPVLWVKNDLTQKQSRVTRNGNNCGPLLP